MIEGSPASRCCSASRHPGQHDALGDHVDQRPRHAFDLVGVRTGGDHDVGGLDRVADGGVDRAIRRLTVRSSTTCSPRISAPPCPSDCELSGEHPARIDEAARCRLATAPWRPTGPRCDRLRTA